MLHTAVGIRQNSSWGLAGGGGVASIPPIPGTQLFHANRQMAFQMSLLDLRSHSYGFSLQ